ncbi:MAG: protein-L-isoaspartate(D-aspartate) O-methyltransferase [Bacteroidales bacterium]|jgi:protein-L-isoaspartate(D-aspartate) O-methyltransferase
MSGAISYEDSYRHKGLRQQLINTIRKKGIKDEKVLKAMLEVPRHFFFDSAFLEHAYMDKAFPIGSGQTISQPYTVAFQTQLLNITENNKVLEIGTGSGYQASILAQMGADVYTIERQEVLYERLRNLKEPLSYKIKLFFGDGYLGLPQYAPFDRILITAAAPVIPQALLQQLSVGGIMVLPLGDDKKQVMTRLVRVDEKTINKEEFGYFRFVPMLKNTAKDK